jgi:hypothetical protein
MWQEAADHSQKCGRIFDGSLSSGNDPQIALREILELFCVNEFHFS